MSIVSAPSFGVPIRRHGFFPHMHPPRPPGAAMKPMDSLARSRLASPATESGVDRRGSDYSANDAARLSACASLNCNRTGPALSRPVILTTLLSSHGRRIQLSPVRPAGSRRPANRLLFTSDGGGAHCGRDWRQRVTTACFRRGRGAATLRTPHPLAYAVGRHRPRPRRPGIVRIAPPRRRRRAQRSGPAAHSTACCSSCSASCTALVRACRIASAVASASCSAA